MKKHRVPDILIEQLLLGELPEARARLLRQDPQVLARMAELEASNREILERYPPGVMARRIGWRLEKEREASARPARQRWSLPRLAPAAGFAVLLLAAGAVLVTVAPWRERTELTRLKGARPHLVIYRKTDGGAEALTAGSGIHAGDVLQIGYVAAARRYGVIFSIDGRGVLTLHFPASPGSASLLSDGGQTMLDYAYQLDDAPGFERFFLVTSDRAPPVAEVLAAGRRLAADPRQARRASLGLPAGLEQWSVLLEKK
jgi:hypothetical protein